VSTIAFPFSSEKTRIDYLILRLETYPQDGGTRPRVRIRAFERLELLMGKPVRAVLRGRGDGNITLLPDHYNLTKGEALPE
jgi:hypothetical protein